MLFFCHKKRPLPTAGAKPWILYVNLKCTHSRKLGALYQFVVRKPVREYANDYLYTSENIFVQTEPHIHSGCRFPYLSSNVNPVNSTYHLSNLSTQHPQYQNQPLNSPLFSTVDQFPLTHKTKKSGNLNLPSDPLTSPDSQKSLVFYTFPIFYSLTFDINTTHSTWHERTKSTSFAGRFIRLDPPLFLPSRS